MDDMKPELHEKLARLQWLLQRHHIQNCSERGPFADPSRGQGRVLAVLKMQPEISMKDLSYVLGIRQQSLSELLGKLEKAGYITREPSEADRRVTLVRLTEKGRAEQLADTDCNSIFDCLSPEEQAVFAGYLDRIIAALESRFGTEDDEALEKWMKAARSRLGSEFFDRMKSMRGGFCYQGSEGPGVGFFGGFSAERHGNFHERPAHDDRRGPHHPHDQHDPHEVRERNDADDE